VLWELPVLPPRMVLAHDKKKRHRANQSV